MRKLICAAHVPVVRTHLAPHFQHLQYGAATPDGCLQMYAHLHAMLAEDDGVCLLQTDISNAFSTVDRAAIYEAMKRLVGEQPWMKFVHELLEHPMFIQVPEWAQHDTQVLTTASGIGQGDPLSSLIFAGGHHRNPSQLSCEGRGARSAATGCCLH